jgi:hypothetical protein
MKSDNLDTLSKAITEYLVSSEEVLQHSEEILLFKIDPSPPPEEELTLDNIIGILQDLPKVKNIVPSILFTYEQLYRGLKIALRYDEMLRKFQAKIVNNNAQSGSRDDVSYCHEYDQHYSSECSGNNSVFEKVTDSWKKKSKATKMKVLKGGELVSINDEATSLIVAANSFASKLRFDTLGSDPFNNTSLGGPKSVSPKKPSTNPRRENPSNQSTFTKIDVNPTSAFLAQTESYRHKNDISSRKTQEDIDREYRDSMRAHRPIPTKKFMNKRNFLSKSNPAPAYQM